MEILIPTAASSSMGPNSGANTFTRKAIEALTIVLMKGGISLVRSTFTLVFINFTACTPNPMLEAKLPKNTAIP